MDRKQTHDFLKDMAEPLHEAERLLAKLPNRVRACAALLHVAPEVEADLLEKLDRVECALKAFHGGCETVAKSKGMDVTLLAGPGVSKPG